jgi:hypothetical protein
MESSREKCPNFFVSQSSSAVGAFFRKEYDPAFCYDVDDLMNSLGIKHDPQEWRLFIDSSKLSEGGVAVKWKTTSIYSSQTCCPHERNLCKPKAAAE